MPDRIRETPPLTALLFDLDGTLVDSVADLRTAVNNLRAERHLPPLPLTKVRACVGDGATALVQRTLPAGTFSSNALQRFLTLYSEVLLDQTRPYPGIVDFLAARRHWPLAVVTNKPEGMTHTLLAGLGLDIYFPVIIGGDTLTEKKPHPAPVLAALKSLRCRAKDAVMIGDHHTDLRAGAAAGARTCFCAWGIGDDDGLPADYRAATVADLQRLFPVSA